MNSEPDNDFSKHMALLKQKFAKRTHDDAQHLAKLNDQLVNKPTHVERAKIREELQHLAHRLAGGVGIFGLDALTKPAIDLETAIDGNEADDDVTSKVSHLIAMIHEHVTPATPSSKVDLFQSKQAAPEVLETERAIVLVEHDDHFDMVSQKIATLGYTVIDGRIFAPPKDCVAVIINTSLDPDLMFTKWITKQHRVVLLADDRSFHFRVAAARAGAEAVLWSPLDIVELGAWLADFDTSLKEKHTILVVDDDDLAAASYAMAIEMAGMDAHVINDATKVLDAIDRLTPDLILMDVNMPDASGIEVAQVIRQSRNNLSLPIVFLSAERNVDRQQVARRIGGDDFIAKPVNIDHLATLVSIRAERSHALRQIMERDSLTGLLNHAHFKERLTIEIERSRRTQSPLSVCLLDLDHFKRVNDTYGHQAGDQVIQTLARTLTSALRRTDIVARYGGEEFGVILLDTAQADAHKVMDKIRKSFSAIEFRTADALHSSTLSVGIASATDDDTVKGLIGRADTVLYQAKHEGRNRVLSELYQA